MGRWWLVNFATGLRKLKSRDTWWIRYTEPEYEVSEAIRSVRLNPGPDYFLSLSQGKVKVGFWRWVVRWSKGSCFKSTKVNPWHSQTTNRSIRDHFSIKQNHQGPSQRRLTDIWKNPKFGRFQWGGRWDGGDGSTSSKWFETKFPRILYGQRVLSQKMSSYNPKLSEWFHRAYFVPIII